MPAWREQARAPGFRELDDVLAGVEDTPIRLSGSARLGARLSLQQALEER
jgi:hypothetical protein